MDALKQSKKIAVLFVKACIVTKCKPAPIKKRRPAHWPNTFTIAGNASRRGGPAFAG